MTQGSKDLCSVTKNSKKRRQFGRQKSHFHFSDLLVFVGVCVWAWLCFLWVWVCFLWVCVRVWFARKQKKYLLSPLVSCLKCNKFLNLYFIVRKVTYFNHFYVWEKIRKVKKKQLSEQKSFKDRERRERQK